MTRRGAATNTLAWTSYNYPSQIVNSATENINFLYGPDRQRWRTQYVNGSTLETTYHVGNAFQKVITGSTTDYRHYINAGSRSIAVYSRQSTGTNTLRYVLEDHQGSVANLLTSTGTSYVKENFSAFGERRNPATWSGAPTAGDLNLIAGVTREGYTWQTALGNMGLNHMNGRVQDAISGRFLSPDPNIPDEEFTQSYNRLAYVNNNPMTMTDPTGFCSVADGFANCDTLPEVIVTAPMPDLSSCALVSWYAFNCSSIMNSGPNLFSLNRQLQSLAYSYTGPESTNISLAESAAGTGIDLASVLASAEMQSIRIGVKIGLGIGLGVLPLLQNEDPWGTSSDPKSATNDATLSAIGASGNFVTADLMATYGAGAISATAIGIGAAAVGGYELGRAFNQTWTYFSDGQSSFGTWAYDFLHSSN
jgi:RHS repeat-associated protein